MRDRLAAEPNSFDGAEVVLVTFASPDGATGYQARRGRPFPILLDRDRTVYSAYGLARGSFWQVWSWSTIRRYAEILRPSGPGSWRDLERATDDVRQLGGDMVIAPDGTLAWGRWSTGPADRPHLDDLAAAVRRAAT